MIKQDCIKSICSSFSTIEKLRDSHILITGGTGFVGTWLTEILTVLNQDYNLNIKVYLLARNEPTNIVIREDSNIQFIKSDIRNLKEIPSKIQFIIHAAGSPDSREHLSYPIRTLDSFYKGTLNLLDLATRLPNLVKIVHLSSSKVYGSNYDKIPISESFGNKSDFYNDEIYTEAKRVSESVCKAYIAEFHLPIVIARPFAFIGPFQSLEKPWALNSFIRDAILGGPIRILGNANSTKSYLYGSDLATILLNLLINGVSGEEYNLGDPNPITLIDLANNIRQAVDPSIDIIVKASKDEYSTTLFDVPNCTKIEKNANIKFNFTHSEAIKKTIDWNRINFLNKR
jgi:nucleoside-diphosphate-sugar epimerase